MPHPLRGAAAIVGIGIATQWQGGRGPLEQLAEAVHGALNDAGVPLKAVDGLFTASASHYVAALSIAEYLGLRPKYSDSTMIGGSSFVSHLLSASLALQAGICDVALVCYGSAQRSGSGKLVSGYEHLSYEGRYQLRHPLTSYALAASRYLHEYGATREHLAHVAVSARKWAQHNPEAFERGPLTIDDVLGSRMIHDPLTTRDCCLVTDGGGAVILVRSDRAGDFQKRPVYVLGVAGAHWHRNISQMPDFTVTAAVESGRRAFEMAGVGPADVDIVELYDAFTINTLLFLEDLGFCPKGEAGPFVAEGTIAPGGRLPVNTNGGGLSCNHPGMYGIFTIIEAVRQLRREAPGLQVPDAQVALCHGNGAVLSSQVTAILGNQIN